MSADRRAAEVQLRVPFHDVDPAGLVWHGHYAKYLELARCELLETFGYNYPQMAESGYVWPIVDYQLRFVKAARFNQRLRVRAELEEWEVRLKIAYQVFDADTGDRLAKGTTTQVAVEIATGTMQYASPQVLRDKLGVA